MFIIFKGISGLLSSRKGTLALIITFLSSLLAYVGRLEGMYLAAIIGTVSSIFMWSHHKTDLVMNQKGKDNE